MSIKLEAGKYYKTRDGRKVGPIQHGQKPYKDETKAPWPYKSGRFWYKENGYSCPGIADHHQEQDDIISEWHEPESSEPDTVRGYEKLESILNDAFLQSSGGKGHERHGMGLPFNKQRMQTISQLIDSDAGMEFQAIKKLTEGLDMENHEARRRELLGVIVYVAGIILYHDEKAEAHG